jgi:phosphoglycolate phosphatase-like HAD superfamily hydrolase
MIKLAIFDLDGTVCNTIEDLADARRYQDLYKSS